MLFLAGFRYGNAKPIPENVSRAVHRCKNKFWQLRQGIRAAFLYDASILPAWLEEPFGSDPWIRKKLTDWGLEDARLKKPPEPKGQLTKVDIAFWCLYIIGLYMINPPPDMQTLVLFALLLRVQSGSNLRHVNIAAVKWSDVGIDKAGVPYIVLYNTKAWLLASSDTQDKVRPDATYYFSDRISYVLFMIWWGWFSEKHAGRAGSYFFPRINVSSFNFGALFTYESHKEACQCVALHCGVVQAHSGHLGTFTSQSVRRGNAAFTWGLVSNILHHTNQMMGRMKHSFLDRHYAGQDVLSAPGPLFSDIEEINVCYAEFLCEYLDDHKNSLLCKCCGHPACKCKLCERTCHKKHTCWLREFSELTKCKKPTSLGLRMDDPQIYEMRTAWARYGVDEIPTWSKADKTSGKLGSFVWPGTLPEDLLDPI